MKLVYADFYANYVNLYTGTPLSSALISSMKEYSQLITQIPESKAGYRYADNKWSVRQVVQHVIDAERVFIYRANAIARKDRSNLLPFDEDAWANANIHSNRALNELLEEQVHLRKSNQLFFSGLSEEEYNETGTASNKEISVAALGYIIAGHMTHHSNILKERYLL